jgi:hypothetical protein
MELARPRQAMRLPYNSFYSRIPQVAACGLERQAPDVSRLSTEEVAVRERVSVVPSFVPLPTPEEKQNQCRADNAG